MKLEHLKELTALVNNSAKITAVVESEEYETSADFDADFERMHGCLDQALGIVQSEAWKKHLKDTDLNYDTSAIELARRAEEKLVWAVDAYLEFYEHMQEAA